MTLVEILANEKYYEAYMETKFVDNDEIEEEEEEEDE